MHHEQINEKSVAIAWRGTKFTSRILAKMMKKLIPDLKKQNTKMKQSSLFKGKQSLKELVKQGAGVQNIEITDSNIKSFERVARKYGIDFALKKDTSVEPPKWLVFFKAKDADALTVAFKEFSSNTLKKSIDKPSIISLIKKMKERSQSLTKDKVKYKDKGLEL